jgi:ElaA protein
VAEVIVHDARLDEIAPGTLYRVLKLRVDVFVVEQACAYSELDGRDLEPEARLVWAEEDGAVLATLRLLIDADGSARIGRVATASTARTRGIAARLMERALELVKTDGSGRRPEIVLDAQAYLEHWYERFGFLRDGEDFYEDGIAHLPMRFVAKPRDTSNRQ